MPNPPTDPLAFRVLNEVGIIEQLARNRFERSMPDGLRLPQFAVLNHLVRLGGGQSPLRIARAMQVTKGAMTNTLSRLQARGLVEITPNPDDGRGKCVDITKAGRDMRERCIALLAPQFRWLGELMPADEFAAILPGLEKLRTVLDENRDR